MDVIKCGHHSLTLANNDVVLDDGDKRLLITRFVTDAKGERKVPKLSDKEFQRFLKMPNTRPEPLYEHGFRQVAYIYKARMEMLKYTYMIGVDPGAKTGIAKVKNGELVFVKGGTKGYNFAKAQKVIISEHLEAKEKGVRLKVLIEDARKRKWFGASGKEKYQGAGDIKRQCAIWEEFCIDNGIDYAMVSPRSNATKLDAKQFELRTGWKQTTNEHSRDAGMLVHNKTHFLG